MQNQIVRSQLSLAAAAELGRNTALSFAKRGVDIILTYHSNRAEADSAVAEIQALGRKAVALQLDAGNSASFGAFAAEVKKALKDTWGRETFDYLVNNAGISAPGSIAEMKEADFDSLYNIHFKGVFFLTQKLSPLIADGGRIVNISSGLARFALPGYAAYGALKGGIDVLTRYMAKELGPRGIAEVPRIKSGTKAPRNSVANMRACLGCRRNATSSNGNWRRRSRCYDPR